MLQQQRSHRRIVGNGSLAALAIVPLVLALVTSPRATVARASTQLSPPVIAEGVAQMPAVPVGWRVVTNMAKPAGEAPLAERSLGFLLPDQNPVDVTTRDGGSTRLDPGQALFVGQGDVHRRASTGPLPVPYYALELVVAADLRADYSIGSGTLLYAGPTFTAPPGQQQLTLSRFALGTGERLELSELAAPVLALVTNGEAVIGPVGAAARTLQAGQAQSFSAPFSLTATGGPATVVTAVIGSPSGRAPATTGRIAVTLHACPDGMTLATLATAACPVVGDVADLQIFILGTGANRRTLADATVRNGTWTWSKLPFGDYLLQATALAPGYDRYYVPGLENLNLSQDVPAGMSPNGGYVAPLSSASSSVALDLYALRSGPVAPPSGALVTLGLFLSACPPGVVAAPDMTRSGCTPIDPIAAGFGVRLTGSALSGALTLNDTVPGDAGARVWEGLPLGAYTIAVTLPPGYDGYALRSYRSGFPVTLLADRTGYTFTLSDNLFDPSDNLRRVNIEAYLLTS